VLDIKITEALITLFPYEMSSEIEASWLSWHYGVHVTFTSESSGFSLMIG